MSRIPKTGRLPSNCEHVTFKRRVKGGKVLPKSKWVHAVRCKGRKLKAHNKNQCRKADMGVRGKTAHLFVACTKVAKAQARRAR